VIRYASLDLETSGLSAKDDQILELAIVLETDWRTPVNELPSLRVFVEHEQIRGNPFAINMNAWIIAELAKPRHERSAKSVIEPEVFDVVSDFLKVHLGKPNWTLAGKNVATFDVKFLEELPGWDRTKFRHRMIDPGSMWMLPTDDRVPDTAECMRRAGVVNDNPHSAVHDAMAVIEMVRAKYGYQQARKAA